MDPFVLAFADAVCVSTSELLPTSTRDGEHELEFHQLGNTGAAEELMPQAIHCMAHGKAQGIIGLAL